MRGHTPSSHAAVQQEHEQAQQQAPRHTKQQRRQQHVQIPHTHEFRWLRNSDLKAVPTDKDGTFAIVPKNDLNKFIAQIKPEERYLFTHVH